MALWQKKLTIERRWVVVWPKSRWAVNRLPKRCWIKVMRDRDITADGLRWAAESSLIWRYTFNRPVLYVFNSSQVYTICKDIYDKTLSINLRKVPLKFNDTYDLVRWNLFQLVCQTYINGKITYSKSYMSCIQCKLALSYTPFVTIETAIFLL